MNKNTIIALATNGHKGTEDTVSNVFGKSKTFTIVNVENNKIKSVKTIDNPAAVYIQGSGPIAAKTLADLKVNLVIASQMGPGASKLLEHHKITTIIVDPNIAVVESLKRLSPKIGT
jgi:predicted Fe-Mo cluster-binding NifX family protein